MRTSPAPADAPAEVLRVVGLSREPALQAKVSFEVKRQLLSDLLTDLHKQSGVTLMAAPGSLAGAVRVTARVKEMPLAEVMESLAHLYGVSWSRNAGNTYTMHGSDRSEVEQNLLQMGSMGEATGRYLARTEQQRNELSNAILAQTDAAALKTHEGFPVSALPVDLQRELRRQMEARMSIGLVKAYQKATEAFLNDCIVHMGTPQGILIRETKDGPVRVQQKPEVAIYSPSGELLLRLPFLLPEPPAKRPGEK